MRQLISRKTDIDFMGKFWFALSLSILIGAIGIYVWISKGEDWLGVDFRGGHEVVVQLSPDANSESIRDTIITAGLNDAVVQAFGAGTNQYIIRLGGDSGEAEVVKKNVEQTLKAKFPTAEILRSDYIGPVAGEELRRNGIIAFVVSMIALLAYLAFRFEFAFALGAVVASLHDIIIGIGVYLMAGHALSMTALAAILTLVGYSVNDTIVIYDKVREELIKEKSYNLVDIFNRCLNEMLSRTIITGGLTLVSALALLIFGGGAISDLSLFLVVGIISGTFSTIYIACPVVIYWHRLRGGRLVVGESS